MKTTFLIGPSGVGKTTLTTELIKRLEKVQVAELDMEVKRKYPKEYCSASEDWERFWDCSISCIQDLQAQTGADSYLVVDVGAGSLQSVRAKDFFGHQNTVHVSDTPENTFRKIQSRPQNAWLGRSLEDFKAVEYSPNRQAIYSISRYCIDLSVCSIEEAAAELINILKNRNSWSVG
jgi:shikimate kinase